MEDDTYAVVLGEDPHKGSRMPKTPIDASRWDASGEIEGADGQVLKVSPGDRILG